MVTLHPSLFQSSRIHPINSLAFRISFACFIFQLFVVTLVSLPVSDHAQLRGHGDISQEQKKTSETTLQRVTNHSFVSRSEFNFPTAVAVAPLHEVSGTQHVLLHVGAPPLLQTQVLIVDTGSRFTAWACHSCKNCGRGSRSSSTTTNRRTSTKTTGNDSTFHPTQIFQTKLYDPALSMTMQTVPCGRCQWASRSQSCEQSSNNQCIVQQKYTEGSSWKAYEVTDIVAIDLEPIDKDQEETEQAEEPPIEESMEWLLPFTFGCQTSVTGLFRKQYADGILGLERSEHSLVHHMQEEGLLPYNAFSLCIGRQGTGYMGLGGGLTNRHLEPMKFTPIVSSDEITSRSADGSSMYSVMVEQLWLGHICLVGCITNTSHPHSSAYQHDQRLLEAFQEGKGTILDSGTTDTYLPKALAPDFVKAWYALTGRKLETVSSTANQHSPSHRFTFSRFMKLPTLKIVFANNVTLVVPPIHYMEGAISGVGASLDGATGWADGKDTRELILRVYADEPEGAVLGLNAQRDYDILYDSEDSGRIGFAKANCEKRMEKDKKLMKNRKST